ncbi:PREDICTED: phosphatidylinositol N-acetylglucosaminyltransferase subunit H isoform X2 [Chinchilla lanigera]|uniref:phosphatidylinositol N-acetylglucosaminyltransferase subunit H isoform X2 n=1 Tax=Chinchilla lanigera TaxID=34839 RepID=UPI00038F148E|nr:PREDICTED: phosphatidylinositol N-acetylglucosaminyltransferase subunit H isoform X2 [Chinchilla lanigera]
MNTSGPSPWRSSGLATEISLSGESTLTAASISPQLSAPYEPPPGDGHRRGLSRDCKHGGPQVSRRARGTQLRLRGAKEGAGQTHFRARVRSRRDRAYPLGGLERTAPAPGWARAASGVTSEAAMEDKRIFSDICGGRLALQCRSYSPFCREFCVSCPRLSLRSLTAVTCTVWLAAYGLFALCENSMILSAAIFITLLGLLGYLHFVKIDQETLLIIDSLGIQMTSSYASGKENTTFIEMGKVKDIVINEAIYMKVIYYLCILLKDPLEPHNISQVVPVFQVRPNSFPLIEILSFPLSAYPALLTFSRNRLFSEYLKIPDS